MPVALTPPATPFTCQVTVVFDVPVTVAANGCDRPARTFAVFGETDTVTFGGGGGGVPGFPDEPPTVPVQLA